MDAATLDNYVVTSPRLSLIQPHISKIQWTAPLMEAFHGSLMKRFRSNMWPIEYRDSLNDIAYLENLRYRVGASVINSELIGRVFRIPQITLDFDKPVLSLLEKVVPSLSALGKSGVLDFRRGVLTWLERIMPRQARKDPTQLNDPVYVAKYHSSMVNSYFQWWSERYDNMCTTIFWRDYPKALKFLINSSFEDMMTGPEKCAVVLEELSNIHSFIGTSVHIMPVFTKCLLKCCFQHLSIKQIFRILFELHLTPEKAFESFHLSTLGSFHQLIVKGISTLDSLSAQGKPLEEFSNRPLRTSIADLLSQDTYCWIKFLSFYIRQLSAPCTPDSPLWRADVFQKNLQAIEFYGSLVASIFEKGLPAIQSQEGTVELVGKILCCEAVDLQLIFRFFNLPDLLDSLITEKAYIGRFVPLASLLESILNVLSPGGSLCSEVTLFLQNQNQSTINSVLHFFSAFIAKEDSYRLAYQNHRIGEKDNARPDSGSTPETSAEGDSIVNDSSVDSSVATQSNTTAFDSVPLPPVRTITSRTARGPLAAVSPIPREFFDALYWLESLVGSTLFQEVWRLARANAQDKSSDSQILVEASGLWKSIHESYLLESVAFSTMKTLSRFFNRKQVKFLCKYAPWVSLASVDSIAWVQVDVSHGELNTCVERLLLMQRKYSHLYAVVSNTATILETLPFLSRWLSDGARNSLTLLRTNVEKIDELCLQFRLDDLTFAQYGIFSDLSESVHPSFTTVSPKLWQEVDMSVELFDSLRSIQEDTEFTSSVEIAMGKSEMECPYDLWVAGIDGKPGRPNEQILSMLCTVRAYFHLFIFAINDAAPTYPSLSSFIAVLKKMDPIIQESQILPSLETSNRHRASLVEILDDNREQAAPNRLFQLYSSKDAVWILDSEFETVSESSKQDSLVGGIKVRWSVPPTLIKELDMVELLDFQSSVILSHTLQLSENLQAVIDLFVQQFGWLRSLRETISKLHYLGHFDYKKFSFSFSIGVAPEDIFLLQKEQQRVLSEWMDYVIKVRSSYYFVNFFSLRQLWDFLEILGKIERSQPPSLPPASPRDLRITVSESDLLPSPGHKEELRDFLSFCSPNFSSRDEWDLLYQKFHATVLRCRESHSHTEASNSLFQFCAVALEEALLFISPRHREFKLKMKENIEPFNLIQIITHEENRSSIESLFYISSSIGHFLEREEVLICDPTTSWESLFNILQRWSRAHLFQREKNAYCIASVENLDFDLQHSLSVHIKALLSVAKVPLLIISNSQTQHIVSQFGAQRISLPQISSKMLKRVGACLAQFHHSFSLFYGKQAGCGKTFQIRTMANKKNLMYLHFPIMHSRNLLERLFNKLREAQAMVRDFSYAKVLLHLDVRETVSKRFDGTLFELLYLTSIFECETGKFFVWDKEQVEIAIELPAGNLLSRLLSCSSIRKEKQVISKDNFQATFSPLEVGMGDEFYSERCDGTARRLQEAKLSQSSFGGSTANAYHRLQYVCNALKILEERDDRFPFVLEDPHEDPTKAMRSSSANFQDLTFGEEIPAAECFRMLLKYAKLPSLSASLWSIWGFINVFYWQLRDVHHPESPINCACMPDPKSPDEDDVITKEKIKGQVVNFLISTAREFATRQVKKFRMEDEKRIIAVSLLGFDFRREFNGYYVREEYDNDGEPVFFKSPYFFYFREASNSWVIDVIIENSGSAFSRSKAASLSEKTPFLTTPCWEINHKINAILVQDERGFSGQAVKVSGIKDDCLVSLSESENGLYLCQPRFDDINGKPHFFKERPRRHLFWSQAENFWQISPVCNENEGAYCVSETPNLCGRWKSVPADKLETISVSFSYQILKAESHEQELLENCTQDEKFFFTLKRWNDSNHESLLFSNISHMVSFLSLDAKKMRKKMHPMLLKHLELNNIVIGEGLDEINSRFPDILGALTDVIHSKKEIQGLLNGSYCLNGDSLLKMLAIFVRIRCGIPVILMGECGCGKTMLIRYLCAWLSAELLILDVHGGTTEEDVVKIFCKAKELAKKDRRKNVFVFLDEINTCLQMGLMCEAIVHRSVYGDPIHDNIQILGALNPFRKRKKQQQATTGLLFHHYEEGSAALDEMSDLVYRVQPVPFSMRDFVFDFGALTPSTEDLYIEMMIGKKFPSLKKEVSAIALLIKESQEYIRGLEEDESAASLRDVQRCLDLTDWFHTKVVKKRPNATEKQRARMSELAASVILAIAFVYFFRIGANEKRESFWRKIYSACSSSLARSLKNNGWMIMCERDGPSQMVNLVIKNFCSNFELEDGIALNHALMENLFVAVICILNRIPIFIVGKPGSSKTLTMQVIASNLQGQQSQKVFWRKFPSIYIFQYQCSPMSDSHSIQHQFDMAVRYQEHASDCITVLLLDEVGLAEHSPDMPLKVLHGMLVNPSIAIVGLSNWTLDPAKMNRAICLQRTEPTPTDILVTGKHIASSNVSDGNEGNETSSEELGCFSSLLQPIAKAYHQIYTTQKGRDFIGMRDFYNFIKQLRQLCKADPEVVVAAVDVNKAFVTSLYRNFGGKPELMRDIHHAFFDHCRLEINNDIIPNTYTLVQHCLADQMSRHLMVLTRNDAALPLLFGSRLLNQRTATVLIGSRFSDDLNELHLVQQINAVKRAMANGSTIVLVNHDNIYEALYDVLNQRYLFKTDSKTGVTKKMLRLAIGSRSQLCQVHDKFKIVVIVDQRLAYDSLDLPLLNRFEKQVLTAAQLLSPSQEAICQRLGDWVEQVLHEVSASSYQDLFQGYHDTTIPSLVLKVSGFADVHNQQEAEKVFKECQLALSAIALPLIALHSNLLRSIEGFTYLTSNFDLALGIRHYFLSKKADAGADRRQQIKVLTPLGIVLTQSSILDFVAQDLQQQLGPDFEVDSALLPDFSSEHQLEKRLSKFYRADDYDKENNKGEEEEEEQKEERKRRCKSKILILQCDPIFSPLPLINHSKYLCTKKVHEFQEEIAQDSSKQMDSCHHHVVILLIHLPLGLRSRMRNFSLDFESGWEVCFIDNIHTKDKIQVDRLLSRSCFEICKAGEVSPQRIIHRDLHKVLASYSPGEISDPNFSVARLKSIRRLFSTNEQFSGLLLNLVWKILEANQETRKGNMHLHVYLVANSMIFGGSLVSSIKLALEHLIVQAAVHVFSLIDKNFNLSLLDEEVENTENIRQLWFALANKTMILDHDQIVRTASLGHGQLSPEVTVANSGLHGPLVSRFPFSWSVMRLLNAKEIREALEANRSSNYIQLDSIMSGFFGEEISHLLEKIYKGSHRAFLFDFVCCSTPQPARLPFSVYFKLLEVVLSCANSSYLHSPALVQAAFWSSENKFLKFSSFLDSLPSKFHSEIENTLDRLLDTVNASQPSTPTASRDFELVALALSSTVLQKIWTALQSSDEYEVLFWNSDPSELAYILTALEEILHQFDCTTLVSRNEAVCEQDFRVFSEKTAAELPLEWNKYSFTSVKQLFFGVQILCLISSKSISLLSSIPEKRYCQTRLEPGASIFEKLRISDPRSFWFLCWLVEEIHPSDRDKFISLYIQRILFGSAYRFFLDHRSAGLELNADLRDFLVSILNSAPSAPFLKEGDLLATPSLLRFLMRQFMSVDARYTKINSLDGVDPVQLISTVEGLSCLVDYVTDLNEQISESEVASVNIFESKPAFFLKHDLQVQLAFAKALCFYRELIINFIRQFLFDETTCVPEPLVRKLELLDQDPARYSCLLILRAFCLRCISFFGGRTKLIKCLDSDSEWIKKLVIHQENTSLSKAKVDPFYLFSFQSETPAMPGTTIYKKAVQIVREIGLLEQQPHLPASVGYSHYLSAIFSQTLLTFDIGRKALPDLFKAFPKKSLTQKMVGDYLQNSLSRILKGEEGKARDSDSSSSSSSSSQSEKRCTATDEDHENFRLIGFCLALVGMHQTSREWPHSLLFEIETSNKLFIPTMMEDPKYLIGLAMGSVGWYTCPRGHPYSVGNCTYPMEISSCPSCGATIGGHHHVAVSGVKRVDNWAAVQSKPGFDEQSIIMTKLPMSRLSHLSFLVLRFLVLQTYVIAAELAGKQKVSEACRNQDTRKLLNFDFLVEKRTFFWTMLKTECGYDSTVLTTGIIQVLSELVSHSLSISTANDRGFLEDRFNTICNLALFSPDSLKRLIALQDQLDQEMADSTIKSKVGDFFQTFALYPRRLLAQPLLMPKGLDTQDIFFWKVYEKVSFKRFRVSLHSKMDFKVRYPFLSAFLNEERRLGVIRTIADIFAWHSVLFQVFPHSSISREQAQNITNLQTIERLPGHQQAGAERVLRRFCKSFNQAFPLVQFLYECQENPFLSRDRKVVDLTGQQRESSAALVDGRMSFATPISFSLPSVVQGETDAQGICTIQLLNILHNAFCEILNTLQQPKSSHAVPSLPKVQSRDGPAVAINPERVVTPSKAPSISYMTPTFVIQQHLIYYDRKKTLMPLLFVHSRKAESITDGSLHFDHAAIEEDLQNALLSGKSTFNLRIIHFQYSGDAQKRGRLTSLRSTITQDALSSSVTLILLQEIDTQSRVAKLMQLLEVCVHFLVSTASSLQKGEVQGDLLLSDYVLKVLQTDREVWDEISSPTLNQQVSLKHLQSLFMVLEESMGGSALEKVHHRYREPLPASVQDQLSSCHRKLNLELILPALRDLLVEQLCSPSWDAAASLKNYLIYTCTAEDLEESEWYQTFFPDSLTLAVALETYRFLHNLENF